MPSRPKSKEAQAAQDALLATFLRLYLRLERTKVAIARDVVKGLNTVADQIAADFRRAQVFDAARPMTKLGRLKEFSRNVSESLKGTYSALWMILKRDLYHVAYRANVTALKGMNAAAGFNLVEEKDLGVRELRDVVSNANILGAPLSVWLGRQETQLGQRIADIARAGVLRGDSAVLDKVERDALPQAQVRLDALARSAVAAVAADAVMATLKANKEVVRGVQWMSVLDNHTTEQCQGLNGRAWDIEGKPIGHDAKFPGEPPIHWGCRSMIIPGPETLERGITCVRLFWRLSLSWASVWSFWASP